MSEPSVYPPLFRVAAATELRDGPGPEHYTRITAQTGSEPPPVWTPKA